MKLNKIITFEERVNKAKSVDNSILTDKNIRFKLGTGIYRRVDNETREVIFEKQHCLLLLEDIKTRVAVVHLFTNFIFKYKNKSYNTMKSYATTVQRFLNYILKHNVKYKLKTFADIERYHGIEYLETQITFANKSLSYFNSEKRNLDKFFRYLAEKELLNKIVLSDFKKFEYYRKTKNGKIIKNNGFTILYEATAPTTNNEPPLHYLHPNYVMLFLQTAIEVAPRIALGIYLQIFGLLRASEVLNVTRAGITCNNRGISVNVNSEIISDGRKNINYCGNKSKSDEPAFAVPYGTSNLHQYLYETHLNNKYYATEDNTGALFSNTKGKRMSYKTYRDNFIKVKDTFINRLLKSERIDNVHNGLFLKQAKWSTHIGRGIGSNLEAEKSNGNISYLQKRRRDKNPRSCERYICDTTKFKNTINNVGTKMYEEAMKKFSQEFIE